ncbi:unnamed protein product [Durusdinium trenchii]|uniref:Reverse transcriptase domain-containing protein n=1 Tax=Durusdinium trenchii TaxID=1381693 RepID=A0ABP0S3I8_9DINO
MWLDRLVGADDVGTQISVVLMKDSTDGEVWCGLAHGQRFRFGGGTSYKVGDKMTFHCWIVTGFGVDGDVLLNPSSDSAVFSCGPGTADSRTTLSCCSGLGGIILGSSWAGFATQGMNDISPLASKSLAANFGPGVVTGDLACPRVARDLHQLCEGISPILEAGFPCQPYSVLGDRRGSADERAAVLTSILRLGWLTQCGGVVLECVPGASADQWVRSTLSAFATKMGFQTSDGILHLERFWPSRRSRWWWVATPSAWKSIEIHDLPRSGWQKLSDILKEWPVWDVETESSLQWTQDELKYFRDVRFGPDSRRLNMSGQAPTALHSIGAHFRACPCGCRGGKFSDARLAQGGLHSIEIRSARDPTVARHPHPQELGFLQGIDLRYRYQDPPVDQLCLIGDQPIWESSTFEIGTLLRGGGGPTLTALQHILKSPDMFERDVLIKRTQHHVVPLPFFIWDGGSMVEDAVRFKLQLESGCRHFLLPKVFLRALLMIALPRLEGRSNGERALIFPNGKAEARLERMSQLLTHSLTLGSSSLSKVSCKVVVMRSGNLLCQKCDQEPLGQLFVDLTTPRIFLQERKSLSVGPLALLIIGSEHIDDNRVHALTVPARYAPSGAPVLVQCRALQLGDVKIEEAGGPAPEVGVLPTKVVRIQIFRDEFDGDWEAFTKKPVRALIDRLEPLQLCREAGCTSSCHKYHPTVEENGVESAVVDLWGNRWASHEGKRGEASEADVFSLFVRIPESGFNGLHKASGQGGIYIEPRLTDGAGTDGAYAVIWLGHLSGQQVRHIVKTEEKAIATTRLGKRFGIRVREANASTGSKAWEIGARKEPPSEVLKLASGFVTVPSSSDAHGAVNTKIQEVENRVREQVESSLKAHIGDLVQKDEDMTSRGADDERLTRLEDEIVELREQGARFEEWFQQAGAVAKEQQARWDHFDQQLQSQADFGNKLAQSQLDKSLDQYFQKQGTAISGRGDSPVSVPSDDDDAPSDQGASMLDELEFIPWTIGELGELLLEPISKEIVLSKGGLRAVMGDFNAAPGTLSAHKLWRQCGWVEVQEELFARFGVEPSPTCKGSSRPDQIWVCPELARLLTATAVVPIFPDHDLLLAKFHVPNDVAFERHWQMPTKLPWHAVDKPALEAKLDTLEAPSTSEDPTTELKRWARRVEACVRDTVVDASIQLIRVAHPFPEAGALKWTLEGVDAVVTPAADGYIVESDLLLIDGQRLSCKVLVDEIAVIHDRLLRLWNARWGKHLNVPDDHWHRIVSFAANFLPRGHCPLPAISFDVWIQAVKSFKTFAARGTDGIAREDLLSLPRKACLDLIEFFHRAEQGQGWPDQWLRAHMHCLAKKDDAEDVGSYRPITLFSLAYRVWAGIRAKQILSFLGLFRFEHQSGFLPHAMASDVWFFVQAEIETAYATGSQRCGLVADLVKAYNTIPRLPVKCFLNTVGAPEALTACWHDFLGGLKRCFVVRNSVSDSALSFTGYPEGCPLSCCAMVCLDIAWHAYQQKFAPVVQHFSFVDNLELVASDVRSLIRSFCVMEEFSRICDLEIDRPKLYSWATSSTNRRALEAGGFRIQLEARDLGGQANYSAKSFVKTITARIDGIQSCFSDLRKSTLDTWARVRCLSNALWPRALHGCESVRLGEGHFAKLRSGAMTACRWNRPGSSPWVRIALLKTEILDPEFFQLWRSLWLIRRQCSTNHKLRALWALFMTSALASKAQGPFSKLVHLLHDIGWSINEHFCVEVPYGFQFNLLECSEAELKCLAAYFWRQKAAKHVKGRRSLADLDGYEAAHAEQFDRSLSRSDCELLCIVRDGGHFTKDCISHFSSESGLCDLCQVEDSREHRFLTCPRYVGAREHFPDLASKWWALKDSLALHGLTSANPFKPLYWQALFALQNYEIEFRFPPPASDCWMIFTDGSGSNQQNKELALSAWAVISADEDDIVCSGWTPGLIQSVPRAETWALLAAVRWVSNEKGNAHIWIDNQGVVEVGRSLISGFDLPDEVENEDLWRPMGLA